MKIFTFQFETKDWTNESQIIDPDDLDSDSFFTELAYSNLIIQETQNPEKKIEIKNAEICYIVVQLEFLLEKFEKQQITQISNIKSMYQKFDLEFLSENNKIYLMDKNISENRIAFDFEDFKKEFIVLKKQIKTALETYYPDFKSCWENF